MRYFSDVVADPYGNSQKSVSVTVNLNGSTATIYSDSAGTTTTNPVTSNGNGIVSFYYNQSGLYTFWVAGVQYGSADLEDLSERTVSVTDYPANGVSGAVVDKTGVVESSAGILAALNTGKNVRVPAGTYKLAPAAALSVLNNGLQTIYGDGPVTFSVTMPASNILFSLAGPTAFKNITFDFNSTFCRIGLAYAGSVGNVVLRHLVFQNATDTDNTSNSIMVLVPPNGNTFDIEDIAFNNCKKKGNGIITDSPGSWVGIYIGTGTTGPTQGRIHNIRFNGIHNIDAGGSVIYEDTAGIYILTGAGDTQNRIEVSNIFGLEFGKRLVKVQASNVSVSNANGYSTTGDSTSVVGFLNGTPGTDDKYGCSGTNLRAYGLMEAAFAYSAPGVKWKNLTAYTTPGNKAGMSTASFGLQVLGDDGELDGFDCGSTYLIGIGSPTQIIKNTKLKNLRMPLSSAVAFTIGPTSGSMGFDGLTIDGVRVIVDSTFAPAIPGIIDTSNYLNGTTVIGRNVIVNDVHVESNGPANSYGLQFKYITNISLTKYRYANTSGNTHWKLAIFDTCANVNVDDVTIEGANTIGVILQNCTGRSTVNRVQNPNATTAAVYSNNSTSVRINDTDPTKIGYTTTNPMVNGAMRGSKTFDPPSLAAGATQQTTLTVTGATVGMRASATFSLANADIQWHAEVTAADTLTVTQWNRGAGAVDLASGTLSGFVYPE